MMRVECASADLQRVFNIARAAGIARPARTVRDIGSRGSRVSPHQGCLDIAVMLKGPHPSRVAVAARHSALIVFIDRGAALICVFAIGAYKLV